MKSGMCVWRGNLGAADGQASGAMVHRLPESRVDVVLPDVGMRVERGWGRGHDLVRPRGVSGGGGDGNEGGSLGDADGDANSRDVAVVTESGADVGLRCGQDGAANAGWPVSTGRYRCTGEVGQLYRGHHGTRCG